MSLKPVTVVLEGAEESERQIEIAPGTTVGEGLAKAGLDPREVHMTVPGADRLFDPSEDLYRACDPGEKLSCSPALDAGFEEYVPFFAVAVLAVIAVIAWMLDKHFSRSEPISRGGGSVANARFGNAGVGKVSCGSRAGEFADRWLRRNGWARTRKGVEGRFRTGFGTFPARVEKEDGGYQVYFRNPPSWIRRGRHSACWIPRTRGWWLLHQNRLFSDVVTAIRSAETFVLAKAAENGRVSA